MGKGGQQHATAKAVAPLEKATLVAEKGRRADAFNWRRFRIWCFWIQVVTKTGASSLTD